MPRCGRPPPGPWRNSSAITARPREWKDVLPLGLRRLPLEGYNTSGESPSTEGPSDPRKETHDETSDAEPVPAGAGDPAGAGALPLAVVRRREKTGGGSRREQTPGRRPRRPRQL